MSDLQFKFYCPSSGGELVDYTVPVSDMADYPWEPIELLGKDVVKARKGKVWLYQLFHKNAWSLHFRDVSANCVATMGSLARSGTDFLFIDDVNDSGGTGTCISIENRWAPIEKEDGNWDFDLDFEEVV